MAKGSLNQGQLKCDSWSTHRKMEGQWQPTSLLYFFELEIPLSPKLREAVKDQHKEWGETSPKGKWFFWKKKLEQDKK